MLKIISPLCESSLGLHIFYYIMCVSNDAQAIVLVFFIQTTHRPCPSKFYTTRNSCVPWLSAETVFKTCIWEIIPISDGTVVDGRVKALGVLALEGHIKVKEWISTTTDIDFIVRMHRNPLNVWKLHFVTFKHLGLENVKIRLTNIGKFHVLPHKGRTNIFISVL